MKLGKSALLEIVALVQEGIIEGKDISEQLRQLDLKIPCRPSDHSEDDVLELSADYLAGHPRATNWEEAK